MLVGRRTWEVGDRMEAEEPGSTDYPFSGPMFLLTQRPLEPPDPEVTILSGDIGEAVATALVRMPVPGRRHRSSSGQSLNYCVARALTRIRVLPRWGARVRIWAGRLVTAPTVSTVPTGMSSGHGQGAMVGSPPSSVVQSPHVSLPRLRVCLVRLPLWSEYSA
jgi:hypothetical protein